MKEHVPFTEVESINQLILALRDEHTLVIKIEDDKIHLKLFNSAGNIINLQSDDSSLERQLEVSIHKFSQQELLAPHEQNPLALKINSEIDSILINNSGKKETIPFNEIIWLEAGGNHTLINTINRKYIIRKPLKGLTNNLDKRFQQCHKKYYINLDFLKIIKHDSLYLNNGHVIPMSRFYQKTFREQATVYLQLQKC